MSEDDGGWLSLREVVLSRKLPRRMLVQPLTVMREGEGLPGVYLCSVGTCRDINRPLGIELGRGLAGKWCLKTHLFLL